MGGGAGEDVRKGDYRFSFANSSAIVPSPLTELQAPQRSWRFSKWSPPPRERGVLWSTVRLRKGKWTWQPAHIAFLQAVEHVLVGAVVRQWALVGAARDVSAVVDFEERANFLFGAAEDEGGGEGR